MRSAKCLMVLYICAKSFQNVTNPSRVIEQTHNTAIQCLTLNYDLDLERILVKHRHYCLILNYDLHLEVTMVKNTLRTSSHSTLHLCQVISKCQQPFKSYRADT